MTLKKTLSVVLVFSLLLSLSIPVFATGNIDSLEQSASDLEDELSGLESELNSLGKEIASISGQIQSISDEIAKTKEELAVAKGNEEVQYETMRSRIKYMYENGNTSLLEILFSASSMADFINRAEFFSEISRYDQAQLEELVKTQEIISQKENLLAEKQKNLLALQEELNTKEKTISDKISDTSAELNKFKEQIQKAREDAEKAQEELEEEIIPVKPSKPEVSEPESSNPETSNPEPSVPEPSEPEPSKPESSDEEDEKDDIAASATDLELFAALIECEAGSTDYEGMLAVASVVVNRMNHRSYPDTLRGVIYQAGQFPPAHNGSVDRVLSRGIKNSCLEAAKDALAGKNNVGNCLSFRSANSGHSGIIIGDNVFF